MSLAEKKCVPCQGGVPALSPVQITQLMTELDHWQLDAGKKLVKSYQFKNFAESMALANQIADLAENENHHPDLLVRWGELRIDLWTHAIDGLSESDFILARKIDRLSGSPIAK